LESFNQIGFYVSYTVLTNMQLVPVCQHMGHLVNKDEPQTLHGITTVNCEKYKMVCSVSTYKLVCSCISGNEELCSNFHMFVTFSFGCNLLFLPVVKFDY